MLRLLHDCGLPVDDVDFINSDGKTMNKLLLEDGCIKLEDAGFDWKILGPDVEQVDYVAWVCDQDAYACSGQKCSFMHENWFKSSLLRQMNDLAARRKLEDLTVGPVLTVRVNTVLGSTAPHLSVKLVQAFSSGSKGASIVESQELKFDSENDVHFLDALPKSVDLGTYHFVFEIVLHDSEEKNIYATGSRTKVPIYVTGVIKVDNAEIAVLDSDLGSIETQKKLDLAGETVLSLSANHLQKLRLSFQLTTPLGHSFKPHQAFLKLRHETQVEHIFVLGNSGKQFKIILDFLGLVEKFFYLSGRYDIQLTVGDAVMENSYLRELGSIELDLPEPPEKATRPPPQPVDPYLRYGPKAEIAHIFRTPEKRPPQELSLAFLALVILPFLGFVVGLLRLGVNLKNFPTSTVPATFAILFQLGIAAVLSLYVLFWLKLDLFTTLKALGFLGIFLMVVGHRTLSHLASTSAKLKSA
ncbi:ribophorin II (RPN2) family protein [Actinidia rufa]|uniref:Ribophorin II n=1 Tax=Actinidia rufa TaxID=165716 RepID=A0A7J0H3L8_9ERIC|nr:ribophorin II (RPN2) family protein [Actinidia rufa]